MNEWIPLLAMVAVPLGLRLIDLLLPKNHHFRFMERYVEKDDNPDEE